jgi:hypothetical protein
VIAVTNIDNIQPVQAPPQRGESRRNGYDAPVQQADATGRAVATQRDAFYFRSQAILRHGARAAAPYLAQQISQMWPTAPAAAHKTAVHAYAQNSLLFNRADHEGSVLA